MFQNIAQTVTIANASPSELYEALLSTAHHSAFTGAPSNVSRVVGDTFDCYGGYLTGVNVELVEDTRVVQAWRARNWAEGVYSVASFGFEAVEGGTRITFSQTGVPEDAAEHINKGWHVQYWDKLNAFFAPKSM